SNGSRLHLAAGQTHEPPRRQRWIEVIPRIRADPANDASRTVPHGRHEGEGAAARGADVTQLRPLFLLLVIAENDVLGHYSVQQHLTCLPSFPAAARDLTTIGAAAGASARERAP